MKYSKLVEMLRSQMFMKNDPARYILASYTSPEVTETEEHVLMLCVCVCALPDLDLYK